MRLGRSLAFAAMIFAALLGSASGQQKAPPAPPVKVPMPSDVDQYKIGPEDVLAVSVWKNEAMSKVLPVRPDGMISLPLLDDIQAAGLTPMQLRDVLANKLAEYVPSPAVSVIVNDVRSFKVSVIGEIVKPARYEQMSRTSLPETRGLGGAASALLSR